MNANQRAARYVLRVLLARISKMSELELETVAQEAKEEIEEHIHQNIDWPFVYSLVRRYAEVLDTEVGFAAEQGIPELGETWLDRPHYTDTERGWETMQEAEARLHFYGPNAFVDLNAETARYVIRW